MAACTGDLGHLYRVFILRDGLIAAASALLPILRSLPRVLETLKYPSQGGSELAKTPLPRAEVLAVAVREGSSGLGVGRQIMVAVIAAVIFMEVAQRRIGTKHVKVCAPRRNLALPAWRAFAL